MTVCSAGPRATISMAATAMTACAPATGMTRSSAARATIRCRAKLEGGAGDDILIGGVGDDYLDGGEGHDSANYMRDVGPRGISVNMSAGMVIDSTGGKDRLYNIEKVVGTMQSDGYRGGNGDFEFFGWGGDDKILGGNGNETLGGGDGHDYIDGGHGNDWISGSGGNDTLLGGKGSDTFFFSAKLGKTGKDIVRDFNWQEDILSFEKMGVSSMKDFKMVDSKTGVTVFMADGSSIQFDGVWSKHLYEAKALFE
jgi:serralysin